MRGEGEGVYGIICIVIFALRGEGRGVKIQCSTWNVAY